MEITSKISLKRNARTILVPHNAKLPAFVSILISLFFIYAFSPIFSSSAFAETQGDLSNDGQVNLTDAILALKATLNIPFSPSINDSSDVNADGWIGVAESIYALQRIAGLRAAPAAYSISGTAAAGAPIIGTVTIKDSSSPSKTSVMDIKADGSFSFNVKNMTPPFLLHTEGSVGGRSVEYFSAATQADINGNINITPFTDLIVANIAGQIAQEFYESYNPATDGGKITPNTLNDAEANLQQKLEPVIDSLGLDAGIDLLRTAFDTDHTGLDMIVDIIQVSKTVDDAIYQLKNILTGDAVVENIATDTDVDILPAPSVDMDDAQQAILGIQDTLNRFENAFAGGLPDEDDPQLRALFSEKFLDYGENIDQWLGGITTAQRLIGMTFSGLKLDELNLAEAQSVISFTVNYTTGFQFNICFWHMFLENNVWKIAGDQSIVDGEFDVEAHLMQNTGAIETGIDSWLEDEHGLMAEKGVETIIIIGLGLPQQIQTPAGPTSGLILTGHNWDGELSFWPDNCNGEVLDEAEGLSPLNIVDNSIYELHLIDTNGQEVDMSRRIIPKRPLTHAEAVSQANSVFARITSPTPQALGAFNGGNLSVSFSVPTGMRVNSVEVDYRVGSEWFNEELILRGSQTSASFNLPQGAVVEHIFIDVVDRYFRQFTTTLWAE